MQSSFSRHFFMKPEDVVPAIIHVWYSAYLPVSLLAAFHDRVLPLIEDVCSKIVTRSNSIPLGKTWRLRSGRSLRLVLTKPDWHRLCKFLKIPDNVTAEKVEAIRLARMYHPGRRDYSHRAYYSQ